MIMGSGVILLPFAAGLKSLGMLTRTQCIFLIHLVLRRRLEKIILVRDLLWRLCGIYGSIRFHGSHGRENESKPQVTSPSSLSIAI